MTSSDAVERLSTRRSSLTRALPWTGFAAVAPATGSPTARNLATRDGFASAITPSLLEPRMRVAVVVNAAAGLAAPTVELRGAVERQLAAAGHTVVRPVEHREVSDRVRAAVEEGVDAVLVGGGDGTISRAAQTLAGTSTTLGILPLGTLNKLAHDLAIPIDPEAATTLVSTGVPRRIDVGEVNGHVFLRNSFLGFPSHLAHHREQLRGRFDLRGRWLLVLALLRALHRYPALPLRLALPGTRRRVRTRLLAVANNPYAEGVGRVLDKASFDAGHLVVYHARRLSMARLLRLAIAMALGTWRSDGELEAHPVRRLVVVSRRRRLRVMNDGEPMLLTPPLRYRIRPRALLVLVPRGDLATTTPESAAA
jgi:diacylglycerol kinase family enzyme